MLQSEIETLLKEALKGLFPNGKGPFPPQQKVPKNAFGEDLKATKATMHIYASAIKEVVAKLEILDEDFNMRYDHNPILNIESRLKSYESIICKLQRKGLEPTTENAKKNLKDIAGVRVVCNYLADVETVEKLLLNQSDIQLVERKDYITDPKPNGYRSLHLIVTVPVSLYERVEIVPVEIQLRTIAMDFWASLEHELHYKVTDETADDKQERLKRCAEQINLIDKEMQNLHAGQPNEE